MLFQIAAALTLSQDRNSDVFLSTRRLFATKHNLSATVQTLLHIFPQVTSSLVWGRAGLRLRRLIAPSHFITEEEGFPPATGFIIDRYYQSIKIALPFVPLIRAALIEVNSKQISRPISQTISFLPDSLIVHVRRGDYFEKNNIDRYGVCSEDYYHRSVEWMLKRFNVSSIYVLTDDSHWCKSKLQFEFKDISTQDPLSDLLLLSSFRYQILSNSSFSAWGNYLASENVIAIAPEFWESSAKTADTQLRRDEWTLL